MKRKAPKNQVLDETAAFAEVVAQVSNLEQTFVHENLLATERMAQTVRERQAKPGSLGLPKLLDERRIQYAIPDGFFREQACFDRVFLFQVRLSGRETFVDDGKIVLSQMGKQRELESAPYGILVSAGLPALDQLRSNGIDLGHIVGFIREAPWRKPVDVVDGVEYYNMLLTVGDITGSIDLASALVSGQCAIHGRELTSDDGIVTVEHVYKDREGKLWNPSQPFIPADQ